jgi:PAS domain S-box-containing protein
VQVPFERAARLATTLTPAEGVGLVRREEGRRRWVAAHGLAMDRDETAERTVLDEAPPHVEPSVSGPDRMLGTAGTDVRSYAGVPVGADAEALFFVTSSEPEAFGDAVLDPLADLAGLIAEAVPPVDPQASGSRHYAFLENVPVGVYRSTPDGRILYANPPLADLFGVDSVEELKAIDLNDEDFAQYDRAAFKEKLEREGKIVQDETVWTRADGETVHVLESARVVRDEEGAVRYYEGVVEDITERKRAERALRTEKNFIDSALDSLPGAFYLVDRDGRFRRWNRQLEEATGYSADEIEELSSLDILVEEDRERAAERIRTVFEEGRAALEARVRTKDGEAIPFYLTGARVEIGDGVYLVGMGIDISDRVAAEEALKEAKQEAEEMNRLKSVFLANMSHEIRTPLTSILGFADVLDEEVEGEAERVVEMIRQSGRRLRETLTSVLELARLEREAPEVGTERCDLVERVEDTLELMRPQIKNNELALEVCVPSAPLTLQADPKVLHRVLTNLVSNAIKFTEEGKIRVAVEQRGEEAVLTVADTGIGISDEFLDQIFDEFRQESEGLTRAHDGSGLGLTITQRLVEMMGGSIEAESTKGEGSTFTVRLPLDSAEEETSDVGPTAS